MTRRDVGWLIAAAALVIVATASTPALPQEPTGVETAEPAEAEQPAEAADKETVEQILREQEQLLRGQRFSYDPGNRRDPFRSLYEDVRVLNKGPRPKGVAGMLVTEIDLVGIVRDSEGGNVAFFTGSDNKGYFLRVGDEVYDGTLIAVDSRKGTVTFRQQIDDPRVIKPYRDVVKRLVPLEEESGDGN